MAGCVYPHSVIDQVETRPVFAYGRQLCDLDEHKPIGSSRYRRMMSLYIGVRGEL
ncbi:hypothetical protein P4H61_19465 [Paenibacillus peoriae]|uniref:hypothetical protein n=1 Tax=Paenibacillus peoriae TaxID=59893 RepID=UPI001F528E9F|nr:hypothetical protein [Paenibacillus peoriae]MEC0183669.1 hypothetical protein [Paenibacillus peoriae]